MKVKNKIVVIVGPTASGKSDLAIKLAQKYESEIISADSRQVYRGLDIGTGKVSKKEQKLIPHHLLDVANPKRQFSVAQFQKLGLKAIAQILNNKKMPIIVGGTGLYVDALVYSTAFPAVGPNPKLRKELEKLSTEQLFKKLQKFDPVRAKSIDPHNPRRLIRALEIIEATGQPVGEIKKESAYEILWLGLNPKDLDQRITKRVKDRFKKGWIQEAKKLSSKKLNDLGLGYKEIGQYLAGRISKKELEANTILAEKQYAKRQMTWFKRNKNIRWLENFTQASKLTDTLLT